jgi:hypothetical protein
MVAEVLVITWLADFLPTRCLRDPRVNRRGFAALLCQTQTDCARHKVFDFGIAHPYNRRTETPWARLADLCWPAVENNGRLGYKVRVELERWPNEAEMIAELYGGAWSNRESWARRSRPEGCIVCTSGHPYIHAVEPFDLPDQGGPFGRRRWPWPR